ncbi:MAG: hypothetical protein R6X13_10815 [bacterium]
MTASRLLFALLLAAGTTPAAWQEMAPVPVTPSGLPVHSGGCLTTARIGDTTFVFAAKGNSTTDFYRYNPTSNRWVVLWSVPLGAENRPVDDGACMCFDGERYIYLVKGNYSLGFHRYDIVTDSWTQLADIPLGLSGEPVTGGTDVCFVAQGDSGWVYLLKGNRCEFYRYSVNQYAWHSLADAPAGAAAYWREGSWLVYDNDRRILAHKSYYHEFYLYDLDALAWQQAGPGMPLVGSSGRIVRSDDGSSAAYWNGAIYALKGNGSGEFWRYDLAASNWTELESVPSIGSTGRIKRPNYGADITLADSALFALKGNTCHEFWRCAPPPPALAGFAPMVFAALRPVSEPLRRRVRVRCWVPECSPVRWRLTDAAGRIVGRAEARVDYGAILDLGPCSPGVYFLTVESGPLALVKRLTVAR